MGASNGRFTVSGPLHHDLCTCTPRASCLQRPCLLTSRKNEVYSSLSLVFASFAIVGPSANDRLAWNKTANYMDFLP